MKKFLVYTICLLFSIPAFSQPFKPGEVWKDSNGEMINAHGGGILFHNGTYYWYGESRAEVRTDGVRCYSSKDLYNWRSEGLVLQMLKDTSSLLREGSLIERPKVIYNRKTGKYVMWFHHELKNQGYNAALTGLALADAPEGPFVYIKSLRPHKEVWPANFPASRRKSVQITAADRVKEHWRKEVEEGILVQRDYNTGQMSRDMTLFVDEDGTAYHVASSEDNQTLHISKLSEDYLNFDEEYHRVLPGGANEAPTIIKHQNKYYMIASGTTGWKPNPARSYVSDHIYGEWKSLGNPVIGSDSDKETTFRSQSTYILPIPGKSGQFIYMGDRWNPDNLKDSRYIWLPLSIENEKPVLRWRTEWKLEDAASPSDFTDQLIKQ